MNVLKGTSGIVLDSDGKALVNGNGTVALPDGVGCVDLGTLTWTYNSTNLYFTSSNIDDRDTTSACIGELVCSKYYASTAGLSSLANKRMRWVLSQGKTLAIKDTNYTDATTFKNSLDGVMLFYKTST